MRAGSMRCLSRETCKLSGQSIPKRVVGKATQVLYVCSCHLPSLCHLEAQVIHCPSRATVRTGAGPPAQLFASLRVQAYDCASLGKGSPDAPLTVQRQAVR